MKNRERILQSLIWLAIICSSLFVSCQNEEVDLGAGANSQTLNKSSNLSKLLTRVSMQTTSDDNVLDSTSCFKVKLPVNVLLNGQQNFTVNSEDDFEDVAQLLQTPTGNGTIDFTFPITVIFPDYSEEIVTSQQQFNQLSNCNAQPPEEAPIGCFSIQYPIMVFGYNSNFQIAQTYVVDNDLELFLLILNLQANEYYSISYPISVLNSNGQTIVINNNSELEALILQTIPLCSTEEPPIFECGDYSPFIQAYDSIKNNLPEDNEQFTMDTQIHAYRFSSNVSGTICSIGYKGDEAETPVIYKIEILDANEAILYEGNHSFSTTQIEYISIPQIQISANAVYTVRRTLSPESASNGIGTIIQNQFNGSNILPFSNNEITILDSDFGFGEVGYFALPQIDFKFVPN